MNILWKKNCFAASFEIADLEGRQGKGRPFKNSTITMVTDERSKFNYFFILLYYGAYPLRAGKEDKEKARPKGKKRFFLLFVNTQ